jgi:hypothetical protein
MLKKILLVVAALIVVFAVIVSLQPADYRIARSAKIAAPPATVFPFVSDFHRWDAWSPWAKLDPAMKTIYEGPASGTGAIYRWSGNKEVGEGQMTLIESQPNDLVRIKLDFLKPFADTSTAEFTFKPAGDQTEVTWSMFGKRNFLSKAVCLFMNMDKMLGGEFEKGLAKMKTEAEAKK